MTNRVGVAVVVAGLAIGVVAQAHAEPGIRHLGQIPTGIPVPWSVSMNISDDGNVVVLSGLTGNGMVWRADENWQPESFGSFRPRGISADGSMIAGKIDGDAAIWRAKSGLEVLSVGGCGVLVDAISADGLTVVGSFDVDCNGGGAAGFRATKWHDGVQDVLPVSTFGRATNSSGSIIYGINECSSCQDNTVWKYEDGSSNIMEFYGKHDIYDCNRSGDMVVGSGIPAGISWADSGDSIPDSMHALAWHDIELVILATDDDLYYQGFATSLSEDGSLVVGFGNRVATTSQKLALVWVDTNAVLTLEEFLLAEGIELTGWQLSWAADMTPDGKYIVGGGQYNGINSGFIIERDIGNTCPPDLTGDGTLDFFDIQAFLAAFAASDPVADFNNDTVFDFFDVQAYLAAFAEGCP